MTVEDILKKYNLDNSFLLGFYGGGNYGDELLLEVLQNLLKQQGRKNISFLYRNPDNLHIYHRDLGYTPVSALSKKEVTKALLTKRNIVVGGGGLWGMDINANMILMSLMLFVGRWVLGKKIFLIGVGYYNSTSQLGHFGAWLAGKSASFIMARDPETFDNFRRLNQNTELGEDIAWSLPSLDLKTYQSDLEGIEALLPLQRKTMFISLRHFKPGFKQSFDETVETIIQQNTNKRIIIALLEPKTVDPEHWQLLKKWKRRYSHIHIIDFSYNPVALYLFFKKHHQKLVYIGPQFHAILTAHLAGVPFMPISYDNKVRALLTSIDPDTSGLFSIADIQPTNIQTFIEGR